MRLDQVVSLGSAVGGNALSSVESFADSAVDISLKRLVAVTSFDGFRRGKKTKVVVRGQFRRPPA